MATSNMYVGAAPYPPGHEGLLRTIVRRYMEDNVGTLAGGIALFALTTLPAILLAVAALYGLLASPTDVWAHVQWIGRFLPDEVTGFLHGLLAHIASASTGSLGLAVAGSIAFAILAAQRAMSSTMGSLNRIAHLVERRSFWRRNATALVLALVGMLMVLVGIAGLVVAPRVAAMLQWDTTDDWRLFAIARWPAALVVMATYLMIVYRFAPCRWAMNWRGAAIGGVTGAVLWVLSSLGLSAWVDHAANYEAMYGAAGGMLVLLLWAYLGALAVLIGGIVAAESRDRADRARARSAWIAR